MDVLTLREYCKTFGIALTGGIATGKSTVGRLLRELGELVIDADQLARDVTAPGSQGLMMIRQAFGDQILTGGGSLDRKAMRQMVFGHPAARTKLESITHPLIQKSLGDTLAKAFHPQGPRRFFYEAALIFEAGRDQDFAQVWSTYCGAEIQLRRLMARDHVSLEEARATLNSQWPALEKAQKAQVMIDTEMAEDRLKDVLRQKLATLSPKTEEKSGGEKIDV